MTIQITRIESYREFLDLEERWDNLLERCDHSIFSTWEWLSVWWKHFGGDKRLVLLLAENNNQLIGIAPLMCSFNKMMGLPIATIEFIGTPHSDYNDFIIAERGEECIRLFLQHIMNNLPEKWHFVELREIPETSKSLAHLCKTAENVKLLEKANLDYCPYLPLPKTYESFVLSMKRKFRRELQRCMRRLRENCVVEFKDCSESFKEPMEALFDLHLRRWKTKGQMGVLDDERVRNFLLDIAKVFSDRGWLGIYSLLADGKTVSIMYGFKYGAKFYAYLRGIDPDFSRYSVGNLVDLWSVEKSIYGGSTEIDLLRGAESYKYIQWNAIHRRNFKVVFARGALSSIRYRLFKEYYFSSKKFKHLLGIP